jgi:hypothetical protein
VGNIPFVRVSSYRRQCPLSGIIIPHPTTLSTRMLFSSGCSAPKWRSGTEEGHQISVPSPPTPRSHGDESARSSHLAPLPPLTACFPRWTTSGPAGETASKKKAKKKSRMSRDVYKFSELSSSHLAAIRICELCRSDRQASATVQPSQGRQQRGVVSWCGLAQATSTM